MIYKITYFLNSSNTPMFELFNCLTFKQYFIDHKHFLFEKLHKKANKKQDTQFYIFKLGKIWTI